MRAEDFWTDLVKLNEQPGKGEISEAFTSQELAQFAATIAVAFLNPCEFFPESFPISVKIKLIG